MKQKLVYMLCLVSLVMYTAETLAAQEKHVSTSALPREQTQVRLLLNFPEQEMTGSQTGILKRHLTRSS